MLKPLRRYASFAGRARRREFWPFTLVALAIEVGLFLVLPPLGSLAVLVLGPPSLAVTVRRLHDRNRSGWWLLPPSLLVVLLGLLLGLTQILLLNEDARRVVVGLVVVSLALFGYTLLLLVWLIQAGTPGANRFGARTAGGPPVPSPDPVRRASVNKGADRWSG